MTPHSLRRLYASLRFALGDDPVYVADQLGHTERGFSMKVYASAVRRRERLIGAALASSMQPSNGQQWAAESRFVSKLSRRGRLPNRRKRLSRAVTRHPAPIAQLDRATPS